MSNNYQMFQKYQNNLPPAPCYQMIYEDGKVVINRGHKNTKGIMKKNTLKKFEMLEDKLRNYLGEFVKYADNCKMPNISGKAGSGKPGSGKAGASRPGSSKAGAGRPGSGKAGADRPGSGKAGAGRPGSGKAGAASGNSRPVKANISNKKIPIGKRERTVMAYPIKTIVKPVNLKAPAKVNEKLNKIFPSNLEQKIVDIERKAQEMQRYTHLLENYFKLNRIDNHPEELDSRLKQILFDEVKNLEEILNGKKFQNIDDTNKAEYETCKQMLQDCIYMLDHCVDEQTKDGLKPDELPTTKKELVHAKHFNISDDDFFDQYNLDINDEEGVDIARQRGIMARLTDCMPDDDVDDAAVDDDELSLSPLQNVDVDDSDEAPSDTEGEAVEEEEEEVDDEGEWYQPVEPVTSYKCDKKKLFQIKDELVNLEHNNQKVLSVLLDMKTSLRLKSSEEEDMSGYDFAEQIHTMKEITRDFGESKNNVDKLIKKLTKHTRYNI